MLALLLIVMSSLAAPLCHRMFLQCSGILQKADMPDMMVRLLLIRHYSIYKHRFSLLNSDPLSCVAAIRSDAWGEPRPCSESQLSRSFPTGGE